ncbi:hypothetical protein V8C40DRAFT_232791 [Trichoderma camerunense]
MLLGRHSTPFFSCACLFFSSLLCLSLGISAHPSFSLLEPTNSFVLASRFGHGNIRILGVKDAQATTAADLIRRDSFLAVIGPYDYLIH